MELAEIKLQFLGAKGLEYLVSDRVVECSVPEHWAIAHPKEQNDISTEEKDPADPNAVVLRVHNSSTLKLVQIMHEF